jgi:hypothetical protein
MNFVLRYYINIVLVVRSVCIHSWRDPVAVVEGQELDHHRTETTHALFRTIVPEVFNSVAARSVSRNPFPETPNSVPLTPPPVLRGTAD